MKRHLLVFLVVSFTFIIFGGISFAAREVLEPQYELVPFSLPNMDITVLYPKDWKIKEADIEKGVIFEAEGPNYSLYQLYREKPKPDETLNDYTMYQGKWLEENFKDYKELKLEKEERLGSFLGNLRIYKYTYNDNTYKVVEFYFQDQSGNFYIALLDTSWEDFEKLLPMFKKLVEGIKITYKSSLSFVEFTSPESDFIIKYPKSWKLNPPEKDMVFDVTDGKGVHIQVLVHKIPIDMDVGEYAKSSGKWLETNLMGYKEKELKGFAKDNLVGYVRLYEYLEKDKKEYVEEYYFTYKLEDMNKGFTLIFLIPEGLDVDYMKRIKELKEKILNSFYLIYG